MRLVRYFQKLGWRRFIVMVFGNVFLGLGISIFKFAGLGTDPYSGLVMAIGDVVGIPYANFLIISNVVLFIVELLFGRKFIGAGTLVNACLLGYIATFFYNIWTHFFALPETLWLQIIIMLIGTVVTSVGVAFYQTPNAGTSPYDSLSLIMVRRWPKVPYFWHRIITDAVCAAVTFIAGGVVGLGTLVCALCLGPIVNFTTVHFVRKLFRPGEDIL